MSHLTSSCIFLSAPCTPSMKFKCLMVPTCVDFDPRSTYCIHGFSCDRGTPSCCIRTQGVLSFYHGPLVYYIILEVSYELINLITLYVNFLSQVYIWNYKKEHSSPDIVLKTLRSLRAVHFHPQAAPFLLTAEVNIPNGI